MCAQRGECASSLPTHQERHQPFLRAPGLTWEQDGVCRTPHAQVIEHLGHLKGQSPEAHIELFSLCPVSLGSLCLICKMGLMLSATRGQPLEAGWKPGGQFPAGMELGGAEAWRLSLQPSTEAACCRNRAPACPTFHWLSQPSCPAPENAATCGWPLRKHRT